MQLNVADILYVVENLNVNIKTSNVLEVWLHNNLQSLAKLEGGLSQLSSQKLIPLQNEYGKLLEKNSI